MAEIGALMAVVLVTASAIGMVIRAGTRAIDESAKDRSSNGERPMMLPPPKLPAT